ncbi:hypothetical protein DM860_013021 [Cuscuta australis]|uniref:Uncharacterized protein n=1 Tax=Cuscuta australis TaxID=267555 RepID=A0A328D412_9ASTE|nr:hypothetical protein DM860_013021 [Cuscuta australis]
MKLEEGSSKADGANPPYHIYATSIMLAKYLVRDEAMVLMQIEFPFRVYRYDG